MEKKNLIKISEGSTEIFVHHVDKDSIPSKSMNVFYNKKMAINRDVTNLAIRAYYNLYNKNHLVIVDSMAASGISAIRILKECENVKKIYINDINPIAVDLIQSNVELNEINNSKIEISRKDANFLFTEIAQQSHVNPENEYTKPNVISIDPFGTPNIYISSAFKAIQKVNGLMCITATDTAVLFGIRPNACIRKYMSKPLHNDYCKEIGARILVYFISRMANINKMGIIPLLTFYSNHFIRVFALTFKNQKKISEYFKKYGYIIHCKSCNYRISVENNILNIPNSCPLCNSSDKLDYAGPLWVDEIHDELFIKRILDLLNSSNYKNHKRIEKILNFALEEINMPISFYNIHKLTQEIKLNYVPKCEQIINTLKERGYKASRTHFDFTSIKTNMNIEKFKNYLLELKKN